MARNEVDNRSNWNFANQWASGATKITKEDLRLSWERYLIDRVIRIFKINDLPDTMPEREVKLILMGNGHATIAPDPDSGYLYAFRGSLGGKLNAYYFPVQSIVNNPWLNVNKVLEIGKDCVLIKNDSTLTGLAPIINKYSLLLAEAELTLRLALVNARAPHVFVADNDKSASDMKEFIKCLEDGERVGVIGGNSFYEGLKSYDYNSTSQDTTIKQATEAIQYLKSSFYLEIGLQSNYNMKRESINESEAGMNESALIPFVDDMLDNWRKGFDEVNKKYGTNISVNLSPIWQATKEEALATDETPTEEIEESEEEEISENEDI